MNKILKKIEKQLKGFDKIEKQEILQYYEELIADRIELGEDTKTIDASLDYNQIRKDNYNKSIVNNDNKSFKGTTNNSKKLLIYLFTSIIWIPLGIVYFTLILTLYILMASLIIVMVVLPLTFLIITIDTIIRGIPASNILINSGVILFTISLVEIVMYYCNYGLLKTNQFFLKLFSKIVLKKGEDK